MTADTVVVLANPFTDLIATALETLKTQTSEYNAIADKIIHADNTMKLVHEVRDITETDDESIKKFRAWKETALEAIRKNEEAIEKYIVDNGLVDTTPIDVEAATEEAKAKAKFIKDLKGVLGNFQGGIEALSEVPELTKLPGVSRSGGSGAGGTGIWRPRFDSITVNGVDIFEMKGDKKISTTGVLSTHLIKEGYTTATGEEISTTYLQQHVLGAADGVKDLSARNGRPIEISLALLKGEAEETLNVVLVPSVPEKK